MKKILLILPLLLLTLSIVGCKDDEQKSEGEILGKWKLTQSENPFSPNSRSAYQYSQYDIIYDFKANGSLVVSEGAAVDLYNDNFFEHQPGEYSYELIMDSNEKTLKIGSQLWWYELGKDGLILDRSPLDGPNLHFVKVN